MDLQETIAAVSTTTGPGVRGVVRLSGPKAREIALQNFQTRFDNDVSETLSGDDANSNRGPRWHEGRLTISGVRSPLPVSIALWSGPRSYTGEDLAEIHLSGSPPLIQQTLAHCLSRGARSAQPGEFTLRAFLRGRLDLTKAEAVFAVIHANHPDQLRQALEQLAGGLGGPIRVLRDRLLDLLAHLEAGLDFVDEADVDPIAQEQLARELADESRKLQEIAQRLQSRDRPATSPKAVLHGRPNAGKSRLFNALAGQSRALVSPIAGTTRDYLSAPIDCGQGWTVELIDAAGADRPTDAIEDQAQDHRRNQLRQADLIIDCASIDAEAAPLSDDFPETVRVWTKSDLAAPLDADRLAVSAVQGDGLNELKEAIRRTLARQAGDPLAASGARCQDSIVQASAALGRASECLAWGGGDELVAIDLRLALDELGKVVGAIVTDDVLDRIFQRFCIGK